MWRYLPGRRPDAEFIAIGISELGPFAPGFRAQLARQRDATRFERLTSCFDVIGMQDVAGETRFVATTLAAQAQHEMGLGSVRSYFEPALGFTHGLVIDLLEAERVDVEVAGSVLVGDTDTDRANFREHR